jgi:branched-chain amino acid transport system substrate-binding protein
MKKTIWAIIIIVIVIIGAIYFSKDNSDKGPIKIGFIGALTGELSQMGQASRAGAEIAVKEINEAGGINGRQVEMIYEDGRCNATSAISAAQKLMSADKVFMIIGGLCSGETSAFTAEAMKQKVPVFSYTSSAPALSKAGKYFFRDYPSDAFQGKFAAEYLYNTLGVKKVAVIYVISDWGSGIRDVFEQEFKKLGGEILMSEGTQQTAREFKTELSKIKSVNPEYVYAPMFPEASIAMIDQMNDLGIELKILGADAWSDASVWKAVSGKADMLYTEIKTGSTEDFANKVREITKAEQVSIGAAQAYDAVKLSAMVLAKTGLDADKFADELRKSEYQGISGKISFDENGDLKEANYIVKRIENGGATEVK